MASLVEELIGILTAESEIYDQMVDVTQQKTKIIIQNDLQALQHITNAEQQVVEQLNMLENKRQKVVFNMGNVLNRSKEQLNIKDIIEILDNQPKEQKQLAHLHDHLNITVNRLIEINNRNKSLIENSLEMIEFNMNFIQSTRMAPRDNNYTKGARNQVDSTMHIRTFDAKQ